MFIQQITEQQTGVWQLDTMTGQQIVLLLPPDGRAAIMSPTAYRDLRTATPAAIAAAASELVAWGSYGVVSGIGAGISVGLCALLVLEPLSRNGIATVIITAPILRIGHVR